MEEKISIIIIAHNEKKYIKECLKSLINQTYKNFELVIVDSASKDNTLSIVEEFCRKDRRIRYVQIKHKGFSIARSAGLEQARGEYIFFIDADCVATDKWIENGLKELREEDVVGVTGKTYYVSKDYKPSIREHVVYNKRGDVYPTCNILYKKDILKKVGYFRLRYNDGLEDLDMAFRVLKQGRIVFSSDMTVTHQKKFEDINFSLRHFKRIKNVVYLVKDHYDNPNLPYSYVLGRVVLPLKFLITFCPPVLFFYYILARKRVNLLKDLKVIFWDYFNCAIMRIIIWRTAFREKIFLI